MCISCFAFVLVNKTMASIRNWNTGPERRTEHLSYSHHPISNLWQQMSDVVTVSDAVTTRWIFFLFLHFYTIGWNRSLLSISCHSVKISDLIGTCLRIEQDVYEVEWLLPWCWNLRTSKIYLMPKKKYFIFDILIYKTK